MPIPPVVVRWSKASVSVCTLSRARYLFELRALIFISPVPLKVSTVIGARGLPSFRRASS